MATDLEICNAALMKLGAETISSFADNSKRAKLCKNHYERIRKEMIMYHPWNFALKRVEIDNEKVSFTSSTDVNITTDQIAITAHGKETNDRVILRLDDDETNLTREIPGGLQDGQEYFIIKVDADNIQLKSTKTGSAIDITSIGDGEHDLDSAPPFEYTSQFALPSDYLRIYRVYPDYYEYKIEGEKIYSDDDTFYMIYMADVSEDKFSVAFTEALIYKIALEFSYSLIQSNELSAQMKASFDDAIRNARLYDAQEGTPYELEAREWTEARL